MSVIILLLIASLSVALLFLGAFIWAMRNRQFEDGYSPPLRILFDDEPSPETTDASITADKVAGDKKNSDKKSSIRRTGGDETKEIHPSLIHPNPTNI